MLIMFFDSKAEFYKSTSGEMASLGGLMMFQRAFQDHHSNSCIQAVFDFPTIQDSSMCIGWKH